MKHPLVIITWEDSVGFDGWVDLDEVENTKLSIHTAVGWLLKETDEALYITQSYDEVNENYGACQVIAQSAVLSVEMPFVAYLTAEKVIPTP